MKEKMEFAKELRRYGTIEDRDDWFENGKNYSWFKILYKGELYGLVMADGEVKSLIALSVQASIK